MLQIKLLLILYKRYQMRKWVSFKGSTESSTYVLELCIVKRLEEVVQKTLFQCYWEVEIQIVLQKMNDIYLQSDKMS